MVPKPHGLRIALDGEEQDLDVGRGTQTCGVMWLAMMAGGLLLLEWCYTARIVIPYYFMFKFY